MIPTSIQKFLNQLAKNELGIDAHEPDFRPVGGGSINDAYKYSPNGKASFFLKINSATQFPGLFQKEKSGLEFLAGKNCISVPSVIATGESEGYQFLLMEWVEGGLRNPSFWKTFGQQLAALHFVRSEAFGFAEDNYMGALVQQNNVLNNWIEFFVRYRLEPQIDMARRNGLLQPGHVQRFQSIYAKLDGIFSVEPPALLHGDLWSGNFMCNVNSLPVLIDPAVYFGHRSVDLGMTTLFGGFDKGFYESYNYHYPLPKNHDEQWDICNLYPLLIHLNLFGAGYLGQIERILKRFT